MAMWLLFAAFSFQILAASASTHTYDWNVTWVNANPDGMQERPVVSINGDRIIANVHNSLGNESTSIHWHGFFQNGTSEMDGAPGATQCGIPPGVTFTYNFTINQTGTYWYHSHVKGQYPDGFRQTLVLTGPENPYFGQYDEERVITLSDWYHKEMPTMLTHFISVTNPTCAEPVPKSALMNDTQNLTVSVEPGRTYLFRLVNVGAFAIHYFWIEGHTMKIVEVDGVWTDAAETDMIYITSAQRYAVLVTMKNEASTNYPMVGSMDTALFDTLPASLNYNVTGWLIYDPAAPKHAAATVGDFTPYDDFNLVPVDGLTPFPEPDHTVNLNLTMHPLSDGAN